MFTYKLKYFILKQLTNNKLLSIISRYLVHTTVYGVDR